MCEYRVVTTDNEVYWLDPIDPPANSNFLQVHQGDVHYVIPVHRMKYAQRVPCDGIDDGGEMHGMVSL